MAAPVCSRRCPSVGTPSAAAPKADEKTRSSKPPEDMSRDELLKEVAYLRAETDYLKKLDALIREEQAAQDAKRKPSKD